MTLILILILVALILTFFEVILPGGILGLIALGCVIFATILGYNEYGVVGALCVLVCSFIAIITLIFIEFKLLAKSKFGNGFFLNKSITGHSNQDVTPENILNKEGITITRLNPSGKILIEGESYAASSQDGYIEADQPIKVVSKDNFKFIIKKI